ncbi:MAG: Gfo/Idh/MocA family oxidoreductase [Calditrichaeota bacterium]|nr:Gfo/Idh/MocA family oxidoreductase [Calditrichota bacterium]
MMPGKISRRQFLKSALYTAGAFTIVPRHVLGGSGFTAPSDQLTKAVIGVGGMGKYHLQRVNPSARLLAVCDVDRNHLQQALERVETEVQGYHDFREVLAREDIDIVHIATPPHWHGVMSVLAAEAGKDIWCEKPMTRTIGEGRKVIAAVQRRGRIFRINTWFRFENDFYGFGTAVQPIKKLVNSGLLGWPLRVVVGAATGFNWKFYWQGETSLSPQWIPEALDYQMWLGPAPYKPYHAHRVHQTFRGYWDYDGGGLGDMGQHYLDPVQYLLGKDDTSPVEIEADAPQQHPDAVSTWRRVRMKYADGCEIILDGEGRETDAPFLEGPDGKLFPEFKSDIPNLAGKLAEFPEPESQLTDFSEAVRTRQKFALNEANAHRSCTLVNLAKIAVQLGRPLRFDPVRQEFINDPGANRLLDPPLRAPWVI